MLKMLNEACSRTFKNIHNVSRRFWKTLRRGVFRSKKKRLRSVCPKLSQRTGWSIPTSIPDHCVACRLFYQFGHQSLFALSNLVYMLNKSQFTRNTNKWKYLEVVTILDCINSGYRANLPHSHAVVPCCWNVYSILSLLPYRRLVSSAVAT